LISTSLIPVYVFFIIGRSAYKKTVKITVLILNIKDAGKGMGMTRNQVLRMIELPLSLSVIIGGIRARRKIISIRITITTMGNAPAKINSVPSVAFVPRITRISILKMLEKEWE
jgi:hypothetical protein